MTPHPEKEPLLALFLFPTSTCNFLFIYMYLQKIILQIRVLLTVQFILTFKYFM